MSSYQHPSLQQRQESAAAVKKALLEKFRAASANPAIEEQRANRVAVNEARVSRKAERDAAKTMRAAELAEQAARAAELVAQAQRETEKAEALAVTEKMSLAAAQKADRDARYAARKAAKKVRRRGF
jgi:hypothetical protein